MADEKVKAQSAEYRRGYIAGYARGCRLSAVTTSNEHAALLAKQLKWSNTSRKMRVAIETAIKCLSNQGTKA